MTSADLENKLRKNCQQHIKVENTVIHLLSHGFEAVPVPSLNSSLGSREKVAQYVYDCSYAVLTRTKSQNKELNKQVESCSSMGDNRIPRFISARHALLYNQI